MSIPVRIEIPGVVKLGDEPDGLLVDAFENSRLSYPGRGSPPLKLKLDLTQAHGIAVQLEEQGFGYGAFWCQPPTVREALWILWSAIRGKELRTAKTPSMKPWAKRVYWFRLLGGQLIVPFSFHKENTIDDGYDRADAKKGRG